MIAQQQPQMQTSAPQVRSTPYQSPMYNYGSGIVTLTNPRQLLHDLDLKLRGKREIDGKPVDVGDPLMNDEGVNSVLGQVESIVNQVTVMGNLKDEEIKGLMDFLADTLAKDLMMNRVKYQIIFPSARDRIYFAALTTAFITMKRAFEEGDRRFWKGSVQEVRTTVENPSKKKGLFGIWN